MSKKLKSLRCRSKYHRGLSPTDPEKYLHHKGKIKPICKECHAIAMAWYRFRRDGFWRAATCRAVPVDRKHIATLLRGPGKFGEIAKIPGGAIACSCCFRYFPLNGRHWDFSDNLRLEPVCKRCKERANDRSIKRHVESN